MFTIMNIRNSRAKTSALLRLSIRVLYVQVPFFLPKMCIRDRVWVNSKEELAGLSDADIAQCKKDAESRGGKAPYCIVIINRCV